MIDMGFEPGTPKIYNKLLMVYNFKKIEIHLFGLLTFFFFQSDQKRSSLFLQLIKND